MPSARVVSGLEQLIDWRGKPEKIRVDNCPEFIAGKLKDWCNKNEIALIIFSLENQHKTLWLRDSTGLFGQNFLDVYFFENSVYEGCGWGWIVGLFFVMRDLIFCMSLKNLEH